MKNKANEESINFIKSFEALLKNNEEFAEEYLVSKGYDPELVGSGTESFANKLIIQQKAKLAKMQLNLKLENAKAFLKKIKTSTESGLEKIQELLNPQLMEKYELNFRDLKEMKESEAMKILSDIEILEILEKEYRNDDSKNKS